MNTSGIILATGLAIIVMAGAPAPVNALDLGDTVSRTTKSLSKTTRSVTRSLSKTTRSATRSVGSTTRGVTDSVNSTTRGVTKGLSSTTRSLSGTSVDIGSGSSGGANISVKSGDTTTTISVLSNYQLLSLGLESQPPPPQGPGGQQATQVTPEYVRALVGGLDGLERQALEIQCADVLRTPQAFDGELIQLCQILASI